jgi:hypothetical protein
MQWDSSVRTMLDPILNTSVPEVSVEHNKWWWWWWWWWWWLCMQ